MVQFLSINFFSWISSIFVGVFKSSRFFVSLCIIGARCNREVQLDQLLFYLNVVVLNKTIPDIVVSDLFLSINCTCYRISFSPKEPR